MQMNSLKGSDADASSGGWHGLEPFTHLAFVRTFVLKHGARDERRPLRQATRLEMSGDQHSLALTACMILGDNPVA